MNMLGRVAHEIWTGSTPGVIILPQAPVARTIDGQQSTSVTGWGFNRLAAKKAYPWFSFGLAFSIESNHKPAVPCRLARAFVPHNHPLHPEHTTPHPQMPAEY
ncbi:hypothetical protein PspLS_04258 [Pyricularia sp. CBS 133598]|nr:hypothetical protein PspLS_04258 [Pyricularia sp. CBS 133598]